MADTYEIVSQRQTKEIVGGTELVDVWEIGARSRPSGVYFAFRVRPDMHTEAHVSALAAEYAAMLEAIAGHPNVEAVAWVQHITPAGSLSDECSIHYRSESGSHRGSFQLPFHALNPEVVERHIRESVDHLGAIAGL